MVKIILDITKSLESNAADYFDKAKRGKKKLEKTHKALERISLKKDELDQKIAKKEAERIAKENFVPTKLEWFEKFHWFYSSEGFLVIGGKDATSNEIVIKKHTDPKDIVLHTDVSGSPFFVIKTGGEKPKEVTLREAAIATASYSRAWKLGLGSLEVFYVNPDQVTKKAKAGEFMSKGSFMVYGKKNYFKPVLGLALGMYKGKAMAAPLSSIKKYSNKFVEIIPGKEKKSSIAKNIQETIDVPVDDIIRIIPAGGSQLK